MIIFINLLKAEDAKVYIEFHKKLLILHWVYFISDMLVFNVVMS